MSSAGRASGRAREAGQALYSVSMSAGRALFSVPMSSRCRPALLALTSSEARRFRPLFSFSVLRRASGLSTRSPSRQEAARLLRLRLRLRRASLRLRPLPPPTPAGAPPTLPPPTPAGAPPPLPPPTPAAVAATRASRASILAAARSTAATAKSNAVLIFPPVFADFAIWSLMWSANVVPSRSAAAP